MTGGTHDHAAVTAALATAAALLRMEVVFVGFIAGEEFTFARMLGHWPGIEEGHRYPLADTFCAAMLSGAVPASANAPADPVYGRVAACSALGIKSYVGVPIRNGTGAVVGTLCGIDHRNVAVDATTVAVLEELAGVIAAHVGASPSGPPDGPVTIRRTAEGWQVVGPDGIELLDELTAAMVLADLLAAEITPGPRPPRAAGELDEIGQLKLTVTQLEHALAARVTVEQAIGVLAERQRLAPRAAFERLRKAARSRGRRVHDLAREVVASATDRAVPLPPELAGRRS